MAKFIQLEEAAKMLGISEEKLNEMRENQDVRAFRDGSGWKFREEDVQELAKNMPSDAADSMLDLGEELTLDLDDSAPVDEESKTVLVSDLELGGSDVTTESTVLKGGAPELSDIELDDPEDEPMHGASDLSLSGVGFGSDVTLTEAEDEAPAEPSAVGSQFEDLEDLDVDLEAGPGSDVQLETAEQGGSELTLIEDDEELVSGSDPGGSDPGSAVELGEDDDEELVLGPGSDITGSAADSGISLLDPADSGLSLEEEPLELSGSVAESLELGEDDMIALDDQAADPDDATQLGGEGDFDLTPLDEGSGEGDSSSQVIELDESGEVQTEADTLLGGAEAGPDMLLDEDLGAGEEEATDPLSGAPLGAGSPLVATTAPEAPYSIWNVLGLFLCILVMVLGGMMTWELFRTMFAWDQPHELPATVMDKLIETVGW